jgi:hypothetical protein
MHGEASSQCTLLQELVVSRQVHSFHRKSHPCNDARFISEFIVHANNLDYMRMNALLRLSGDGYRQDYIAGNIASHILTGK